MNWIRKLWIFCGLLVLLALCYELATRIHQYSQEKVRAEAEKMALYAQLMNKPPWLSKEILDRIISETEAFASRDQATYNRLANPLDKEILAEVAANYTNHLARNENAWIKQIAQVRRSIDKIHQTQTIEIDAEYRKPAAWVLAHGKCYLIDEELMRLPNDYSEAYRKAIGGGAGLMAITGLHEEAPEVGGRFEGADLAAGMKLAKLLRGKKFAAQIDAIDMNNFNGRKDHNASWIVLNTVWTRPDGGGPRVVLWGRTPGEEKFWGISTAAKMKVLEDIYMKFNRIDAGRDCVDIQMDHVTVK
ncbi:MAG: hypothetical protein FWD61_19670 [Phycisphaerales bacterium]|nr:hypothetical protein [Phycisphaerales bacterium]